MMLSYRERPLPIDDRLRGPRLILTSEVVSQLAKLLPKFVSGQGHENVAYLGGHDLGDLRFACSVIMPKAKTAPRYYDTDIASHAEVILALSDLDVEVVGQVHTHPGSAVYHSDGDDDLAFVKGEGFWSIVVPHYASNGILPVSQCGFHLYADGAFHLLTPEAVAARVSVQSTLVDLR